MIKRDNDKNETTGILLIIIACLIFITMGLGYGVAKYHTHYEDLKMKYKDLQIILETCMERKCKTEHNFL